MLSSSSCYQDAPNVKRNGTSHVDISNISYTFQRYLNYNEFRKPIWRGNNYWENARYDSSALEKTGPVETVFMNRNLSCYKMQIINTWVRENWNLGCCKILTSAARSGDASAQHGLGSGRVDLHLYCHFGSPSDTSEEIGTSAYYYPVILHNKPICSLLNSAHVLALLFVDIFPICKFTSTVIVKPIRI